MKNKTYPTTKKEWIKYLTIDKYFTPKNISYRKSIITKSGFDFDEIVLEIDKYRIKNKKEIITLNKKEFYFAETEYLKKKLQQIKDFWKNSPHTFKDEYKKELIFDTLISEAFHSSSIEGAYSTKKRTEEIIKKHLTPQDKSEKMILNNYRGLEYIFEHIDKKLDDEFILFLHKMITEDTLDDKKDEGVYRDNAVDIMSDKQTIIFRPTSNIDEMREMFTKLSLFMNSINENSSIEPIYKIISFHFLYGYIHPHFDGNGRTLRVLFTHLLGKNGYDMFYYISLSEIIHLSEKRKKEYEKAFESVEKNGLDLTYFIYYMVDVMIEALQLLDKRVFLYFRESIILEKVDSLNILLTQRQIGVLKTIAKNKVAFAMTSKEIAKKFKLSTQTILKDIKFLIDFKLLKKKRTGLKIYYELNI